MIIPAISERAGPTLARLTVAPIATKALPTDDEAEDQCRYRVVAERAALQPVDRVTDRPGGEQHRHADQRRYPREAINDDQCFVGTCAFHVVTFLVLVGGGGRHFRSQTDKMHHRRRSLLVLNRIVYAPACFI